MKKIFVWLCVSLLVLTGCQKPEPAPETLKAGLSREEASASAAPAATAVPATPTPLTENDESLLAYAVRNPRVTEGEALTILRYLMENETDFADFIGGGGQISFHRSEPFEGGTLVTAMELVDGEIAPNLYYLAGGAVEAASFGADCWSLNIARLENHTILFGLDFLCEESDDLVSAEFTGGAVLTQEIDHPAGGPESGFLIVADGAVDPARVTVSSAGQSVADANTGMLLAPGYSFLPWADGELSIRSRTHLVSLWRGAPEPSDREICIPGNELDYYDWEFTCYYKNQLEYRESDLWRTNNAYWQTAKRAGGDRVRIANLPDEILASYLVYPALDQGDGAVGEGLKVPVKLKSEGFTLPAVSEETPVILVIELEAECYTLPILLRP